MKPPVKKIYGYVSVIKLCQLAGYDCRLGNAAKRIITVLAGFSDDKGECWPSMGKIANAMGLSRTAIWKQVKILEEYDYLSSYSRYDKENGRRMTNIIRFNFDLFEECDNDPEFFCKRNVTSLVIYLATLLSYGVLNKIEGAGDKTPESCPKKTTLKNHYKDNILKKNSSASIQRSRFKADTWQYQKDQEAKTGVTKAHRDELEALAEKLKTYIPSQNQYINFDLAVNRESKDKSPLEAMEYKIERYRKALAGYQMDDCGPDRECETNFCRRDEF